MPFSRRQLFKLRPRDLTGEVVGEVSGADADGQPTAPAAPRPPGALADGGAFLAACERCGACAEACPHDVIFKHGPATGAHEGTPFLDPARAPCRWCEDFPCIVACPSGALSREEAAPVPPVARVKLLPDRCLNAQGTLCDVCSWRCPSQIRAIRMVRRQPVLDDVSCTGCGLCLYHCEAEPAAFELELLPAP